MIKKDNLFEFEWDKGNIDKNYKKHDIAPNQAEEVFLDERLKVKKDIAHSQKEERLIALGRNLTKNVLFVVFTRRKSKIRIISARLANIKERRNYEKT
ncbi:conserved hypothetical protein [Candidatus Roizmanbacteria bacterium]|nr:conserved hypothetical protein [Candidatus Roizmanbacteria bacterium]